MAGILYLIPTTLGEPNHNNVLPPLILEIIQQTDHYIVENVRTARRYISSLGTGKVIDSLTFYELNKHTKEEEIHTFLDPLRNNKNMGIISEAGVPGVADPGSQVVAIAHRSNIRVVPLVGPSSILLALMASGMNGQSFIFHGYLPITKHERIQELKNIEKVALQFQQAQIFMETPYRNNKLLEDVLKTCAPDTRLCIATDITLNTESIKTKTIEEWKQKTPDLHKRPTIFILQG